MLSSKILLKGLLLGSLLGIISAKSAFSQNATEDTLLTLKQITPLALSANLGIKLAKIDAQIAQNNQSIGAAGMLPQISLNADLPNSINNIRQEFVNGSTLENPKATANAFNANVQINYTIFDGFAMFATRERLQLLEKQSQLTLRQQAEQTIYEAQAAALLLFKAQQDLILQTQNFERSLLNYNQISDRVAVGKASKADLMQAEVDLNTDKAQLTKQKSQLKVAQIQLNIQLLRQPDAAIGIADSLALPPIFPYDYWLKAANLNNTWLLSAMNAHAIAEQERKVAQAAFAPSIDLNAGYHFNKLQSQAGFLRTNQNRGWDYGLSARWNLFNGYSARRNHQNAKLRSQQASIAKEIAQQSLLSQLAEAYHNFNFQYQLSVLAQQNTALANQNFVYATEKFKLGAINQLQLRTAQLSFLSAQLDEHKAIIDTQLAWMALQIIAGEYQ